MDSCSSCSFNPIKFCFFFQLQSFETELSVPKLAEQEGGPDACRGVFIRAPAILEVGPDVEILADYPVTSDKLGSMAPRDEDKEVGSMQ